MPLVPKIRLLHLPLRSILTQAPFETAYSLGSRTPNPKEGRHMAISGNATFTAEPADNGKEYQKQQP